MNFTLNAYFYYIFGKIFHILMFINFLYTWNILTYTIGNLKHYKTHENCT